MKLRIVDETTWIELLAAPDARLTVRMMNFPFRFLAPEGWETGEVALTEHLIYYVGRGRCRVRSGGKERVMNGGDLCWANPGTRVRLFRVATEAQPELYRFRFSLRAGGKSVRLRWDHRVGRVGAEAVDWARRWVTEWEHQGVNAQARMKSFAVLLSLAFFEGLSGGKEQDKRRLSKEMCTILADWVAEEPARRFKPSDLARRCGLSADYFSRMFRSALLVSPKAWILKQRLRYASGMLAESDRSVSEIAAELGYEDLYLFSRQFKKELGLSPRAWRQGHRGGR